MLRHILQAGMLLSGHSYFCLPLPCSRRDRFKQSLWTACQTTCAPPPLGKQVVKNLQDFHRYFQSPDLFLNSGSKFSNFQKWFHETKLRIPVVAVGAGKGPPNMALVCQEHTHIWSSHCGAAEMNPTRNHEVAGLIPGLIQWVRDLVLP